MAGGGEVRGTPALWSGQQRGAWLCHAFRVAQLHCAVSVRLKHHADSWKWSFTSEHFTRIGASHFLILLLIYYSSQGRGGVMSPHPLAAKEPGVPSPWCGCFSGQGDASRNGCSLVTCVPGGAGTRGKGPRRRGRAEG